MDIEMKECPICQSKNICLRDTYRTGVPTPYTETFAHLNIFGCTQCGLGFAYPNVDAEKLGTYYKNYYKPRFFDKIQSDIWPIPDIRSIAQLQLARSFCNFKAEDVFLDIGCGAGCSLYSASILFDDPKLAIIEQNKTTIEFLKNKFTKLSIYESINTAINTSLKAKIILMSHSLEHFYCEELIHTINSIKQILTDDGVLLIEIPNADVETDKFIRRKHDIPHTCFFTNKTIIELGKSCNLKIAYINQYGYPPSISHQQNAETQRKIIKKQNIQNKRIFHIVSALRSEFFMPVQSGNVIRAVLTK